jgi:hypothetical protein
MLLYHESDQPLTHCILGHYYHRRFLARLAQHCASIVPLPTNNTQNSAIYKLTVEIRHCAMFHVTHSAVKSSETYNLTIGPSRLLSITCDPILKPARPLSILGHFLESLSQVGGWTKCAMLNRSSPSFIIGKTCVLCLIYRRLLEEYLDLFPRE